MEEEADSLDELLSSTSETSDDNEYIPVSSDDAEDAKQDNKKKNACPIKKKRIPEPTQAIQPIAETIKEMTIADLIDAEFPLTEKQLELEDRLRKNTKKRLSHTKDIMTAFHKSQLIEMPDKETENVGDFASIDKPETDALPIDLESHINNDFDMLFGDVTQEPGQEERNTNRGTEDMGLEDELFNDGTFGGAYGNNVVQEGALAIRDGLTSYTWGKAQMHRQAQIAEAIRRARVERLKGTALEEDRLVELRPRLGKWSKAETDLFYKYLKDVGCNAALIARLMPGRDRHSVANMISRQMRENPARFAACIRACGSTETLDEAKTLFEKDKELAQMDAQREADQEVEIGKQVQQFDEFIGGEQDENEDPLDVLAEPEPAQSPVSLDEATRIESAIDLDDSSQLFSAIWT